jgi:hypothetical protein
VGNGSHPLPRRSIDRFLFIVYRVSSQRRESLWFYYISRGRILPPFHSSRRLSNVLVRATRRRRTAPSAIFSAGRLPNGFEGCYVTRGAGHLYRVPRFIPKLQRSYATVEGVAGVRTPYFTCEQSNAHLTLVKSRLPFGPINAFYLRDRVTLFYVLNS